MEVKPNQGHTKSNANTLVKSYFHDETNDQVSSSAISLIESRAFLLKEKSNSKYGATADSHVFIILVTKTDEVKKRCKQLRVKDMSSYLERYGVAVLVAGVWGLSTPLLRKGSQGVSSLTDKDDRGFLANRINEITFLLRWQYILPFFLNQSASILFIYVVSGRDVSIVVPLVNALNFVFVFLGDVLLGNCSFSKRSVFGVLLIVSGLILCISSKPL